MEVYRWQNQLGTQMSSQWALLCSAWKVLLQVETKGNWPSLSIHYTILRLMQKPLLPVRTKRIQSNQTCSFQISLRVQSLDFHFPHERDKRERDLWSRSFFDFPSCLSLLQEHQAAALGAALMSCLASELMTSSSFCASLTGLVR